MKKTLLLASAACIIATSANAKMWNNFDPYIGADYAYDNLNLKGEAKHARENFNSAKINLGTDITQYSSWEAFYQFGGSRKALFSALLEDEPLSDEEINELRKLIDNR